LPISLHGAEEEVEEVARPDDLAPDDVHRDHGGGDAPRRGDDRRLPRRLQLLRGRALRRRGEEGGRAPAEARLDTVIGRRRIRPPRRRIARQQRGEEERRERQRNRSRAGSPDTPAQQHHPIFRRSSGKRAQSARNASSPRSVSGCWINWCSTLGGTVATSAPISAASTTCMGWRTEATSTSVSKP